MVLTGSPASPFLEDVKKERKTQSSYKGQCARCSQLIPRGDEEEGMFRVSNMTRGIKLVNQMRMSSLCCFCYL